ncbi:Crp/Fnr family transcriptional regulator [Granulosicoccus sp. 3-233]|uniref:Crp/Fnr family transcriptional regulator n=1 Tax=Granulosicoccus sp. 3-233 TaxID=3417969 RepID=UPI003D33551E
MKPAALTLSVFDIFQGLSSAQRAEVAAQMTARQYSVGQCVISAGTTLRTVHFLVSGRVRACAYNHSGRQVYFEDLVPGMMFGELAALDHGDRSSDCIAMENSLVLSLEQQQFLQVLDDLPEVKDRVLLRLVGMVRRQLQRVFEYTTYSVNQRIRFELLRLASEAGEVHSPVVLRSVPTQAELAERISSHREAVSRELKLLEAEGLITWNRHSHIIHDQKALLKRAGSS